jgi:hypothetical protein
MEKITEETYMAGIGYISALKHQFMQIMAPQGNRDGAVHTSFSQIYAEHQSTTNF